MRPAKVVLGWTLIVLGMTGLAQVFRGDWLGVVLGVVFVVAGFQVKAKPKPGKDAEIPPEYRRP